MGKSSFGKGNGSRTVFIKYALITLLIVIVLLFIVNFLLPMLSDDEPEDGNNTNNIEVDINVENDELNGTNEENS
ncbi:hypothetical protein [Alkalicoccus daliensis]|uniref:Uncharacterized protein n=1 Tax=Alkalicoccus daliensis TaxID=745820 RepID=A0A1H0G1N7_9BACI|nr:hypothetical protein [Alkalicoccus daliensis]SDO00659.1 hypothetical protein SAMN04488053_105188 [Alkalicoccus daliensis]